MKRVAVPVAFLVMLAISVFGIAWADIPGDHDQASVNIAAKSHGPTTGVTKTMTFWDVGTAGTYVHPFSISTILVKDIYSAKITIPAGETAFIVTPLTFPSDVNKKNTTFRKAYLYWAAESPHVIITRVEFASADKWLKDLPVNIPGTDPSQLSTFDLGAFYKVPRGLVVYYTIENRDTSEVLVYFRGYGATIKYTE